MKITRFDLAGFNVIELKCREIPWAQSIREQASLSFCYTAPSMKNVVLLKFKVHRIESMRIGLSRHVF